MLAYVVGIWNDRRRQRPRPRALPPAVPVVVSFGRRRWRASTDLAARLDLHGMTPEPRALALTASLTFAIAPHDLAGRTAAAVRNIGLSVLGLCPVAVQQFVAPAGHDDEVAVRAIAEWADVAREVLMAPTGQHAADALSSCILKVTKLGARRLRIGFDQHLGAPAMKKFASTYERITRESEAKDKAKGKAEGEAKGERTGATKVLLRLRRRRFGVVPETTAARIAAASTVDLDRWAGRVLDARSLAEVFAE